VFKREAGFFVGAILANVVTTELVVLAVCYFALLVLGVSYSSVLRLLFLIAVVFPVAFYHHSWSLWLTFDHLIEGLPKRRTHWHRYRSLPRANFSLRKSFDWLHPTAPGISGGVSISLYHKSI